MRFEFWAVALAAWEIIASIRFARLSFSFIDLLVDLVGPYKEVTTDNFTLFNITSPFTKAAL